MISYEEEVEMFYAQIGYTLTQWAMVEFLLYDVASKCVPKSDRKLIFAGIFAIENFRGKLNFSDKIIKVKFTDENHLKEWADLLARLNKMAGHRNAIAHGKVEFYPHSKPGRRIGLMGWTVVPKIKMRNSNIAPTEAITIQKLAATQYQFFDLILDMHNFSSLLAGVSVRYPKSGAQQPRLLTLQQIKDLNIVEFLRPHPPSRLSK